jgi:hypothetical protein
MKLKSAMRNLENQKEWLGVTWVKLLSLLQEKAIEFPDIIHESFETYREHIELDHRDEPETK